MKANTTKSQNKIHGFTIIQTLQFAEWVASNYVRLNGCWVHMYADQRNKDNFKDTGELFGDWLENYKETKI